MLMLKLILKHLTYKILEKYLNKKIDHNGINDIEKSIEDGIKIYKKTSYRQK